MAERHGAAIDVDLGAVEFEVADELLGHDREGFVDLEEIDVVQRQAGAGEHAARRGHRRVQHQRRAVALVGGRHHAGARFETMRLGVIRRGEQQRRRTVDDAGRIAGVVDEVDLEIGIFLQDQFAERQAVGVERNIGELLEGGLERREAFGRGLRPREFLAVERDRAVVIVHGDEALFEVTGLDRGVGAALALQGKGVDIGAGDALHRGDGVGADALIGLRMHGAQVQVAGVEQRRAVLGAAAARHRHHLGAAGDDEIGHAGHDGRGREVHRGYARAAETIQRHAARAHVVAGVEGRHTAKIAALRAALRAGAPDHVIDFRGVDAGAFGERLQDGRTQALRMDLRQRALGMFADAAGCAAGVDDPSVGHGAGSFTFSSRMLSGRHRAHAVKSDVAAAGRLRTLSRTNHGAYSTKTQAMPIRMVSGM